MTKQVSGLQEDLRILATSTMELKNELGLSKKMILELNETLEQSKESGKKVEEEFNDYKIEKENAIKEIIAEREELRTHFAEMQVFFLIVLIREFSVTITKF
jgi:soluble cytochrome b562